MNTLMKSGGPLTFIIAKSEKANATTIMFEGVLRDLVLVKETGTRWDYFKIPVKKKRKKDSLEEDEDDKSISNSADEPEHKEEESANVLDERMARRELHPVLVGHGQHILGCCVSVLGT